MTYIAIHSIKPHSFVDGPGDRTVLFVQGCNIACPGCQSKHLWDPAAGDVQDVRDVAQTLILLSAHTGQVTLSGGEIMLQPQAIAELLHWLRAKGVRHIVAYTGFTWEQLHDPAHPANPYLASILPHLDVLVDGPFIRSADHDYLAFRGSANQRPIDVPATLAAGEIIIHDWDNTLQINPNGDLILPVGFAREFAEVGPILPSRRCGQVNPNRLSS